MSGNVGEWCATKGGKAYPYDVTEDEWSEPYLDGTDVRVVRGGAFNLNEDLVRCARRYWVIPYPRDFNLGLKEGKSRGRDQNQDRDKVISFVPPVRGSIGNSEAITAGNRC
jgi:hypothetical protein